jgi:hypothetical protein
MPRMLKPSERLARAALEPHLGYLEPVEEITEHKTPDFRTVDELDAVEVKEMTSEDYQKITAVHRKMPTSWDLDGLTGRWTVIDLAPTMSDTHEPMPAYPEVDQATIDHYAAYGMRVQTVAEREADWHEEATRPRPQIRLHDLGPRLEPDLAVLEQEGDTEVDSYAIGRPERVRVATAAIRGLIHGALCHRRDPLTEEQAGVDVWLGQAYVRTGRPDTIAQRVQLWLDRGGKHVTNLVETLDLEQDGTRRHAALVLAVREEPEYRAAVEMGTRFVPTIGIDLPDPVDVLWVVLGPVVMRYAAARGWHTSATPPHA